jgi:hypothetical protein
VNELTLLRELVGDEPIDDEAARAEVWRRMEGDALGLAGKRRRRILVAMAATAAVAVVAASAFATVREVFFVKPFAQGKVTRTVDGIRFSLSVPRSGWENGPHVRVNGRGRTLGLYVSKSFFGPQDADVVLLWTAFPKGGLATPCTGLVKPAAGRSTADLVDAMSRARGIKVVDGPTRVTVGGRPAWHASLSVRRDRGCDPGYFFTWDTEMGGAFWNETRAGYEIEVWVVDLRGKRLVFEAESKGSSGIAYGEVTKIVDSIRFG